jgi:hypothetical protein
MRITFGGLRIGTTVRKYVQPALEWNWISEGFNVHEADTPKRYFK